MKIEKTLRDDVLELLIKYGRNGDGWHRWEEETIYREIKYDLQMALSADEQRTEIKQQFKAQESICNDGGMRIPVGTYQGLMERTDKLVKRNEELADQVKELEEENRDSARRVKVAEEERWFAEKVLSTIKKANRHLIEKREELEGKVKTLESIAQNLIDLRASVDEDLNFIIQQAREDEE